MARAALDDKAEDLVILNLKKLSFSFDYFFLCTASSDRRIQAIAEHMQERLRERGEKFFHMEGKPEGGWVLLDYGTVIGHLFSSEARAFYQLERLWADASRVPVPSRKDSKQYAVGSKQ